MQPQLKLNPGLAQWAVQAFGRALATYAILQGFNILAGGRDRWVENRSYDVAIDVPGAPESWGLLLLGIGIFALVASLRGCNRMTALGQVGLAAWSLFFALSYIAAAFAHPGAATTGIYSHGIITILSAVVASIYHGSTAIRDLEKFGR